MRQRRRAVHLRRCLEFALADLGQEGVEIMLPKRGTKSQEKSSRLHGLKARLTRDRDSKPATLAVNPDGIPAELKALRQWVVWRWIWRDSRWTKEPHQPRAPGKRAKVNDPETWGTFKEALSIYHAR